MVLSTATRAVGPPPKPSLPSILNALPHSLRLVLILSFSSSLLPLFLPSFPERFHLRPLCHVLFVSFARPRARGMMGDLPGAGAPVPGGGVERSRKGRTRFRGGMLVATLKSRYFRHRCYRCFLHSVSSVTINEVTDQSGAGIVGRGVSLRLRADVVTVRRFYSSELG